MTTNGLSDERAPADAAPSSPFDGISLREALNRQAGLMLIVGFGVMLACIWMIQQLPDVYVARSTVSLEKRRLPKSFQDAAVVVPTLSESIGYLRQEALSREVMRKLITELKIHGGDPNPPPPPATLLGQLTYSDPVESTRKSIDIAIQKNQDQEFLEITARAGSGEMAAKLVNRVTDILAEKNRDLRLRLAGDVNAFLDGELEKARRRLASEEARLADFRKAHGDALPETQERTFERLRILAVRDEERRSRLDEARERLAQYELEVEGLRARARAPQAVAAVPGGPPTISVVEARSSDAVELDALRRRLDEVITKYTPDHPERISLESRIAALESRLRSSAERAVAADPEALAAFKKAQAEARRLAQGKPASGKPAPAAPLPAKQPLQPLDRKDAGYAKLVVADLIANGAPPDVIAQAERILSTMVAQGERIASIERDQRLDAQEIARLEQERTARVPLARELEKIQLARDDAQRAQSDLAAERATMERYVEAEKVLQGDRLRPVEAATAPALPSEPRRGLLLCLTLFASLGLGLGAGYAGEVVHQRGKRDAYAGSAHVETELGVPVLAVLPALADPGRAGDSPILSEQLNRVRHRVLHHPRFPKVRSILVTSAAAGEGKTTVSLGLARAFAASLDDRALLIEADLHRPSVSRALGVKPRKGISEHLVGGEPLAPALKVSPKLFVVSAGERPVPTATVVSSKRMRHLVEELGAKNPDWTMVIDAPPMGSTLEPLALAQVVDGVILVVRADDTPRQVVQQALRELPEGKLLGIVLNALPEGRDEPRLFGTSYYTSAKPGSKTGYVGAA